MSAQKNTDLGDRGDSPIDPSALDTVFGDNEAGKRDILEQFASQAERIVESLDEAFRQRDETQISFQAHKLKSSARTVGANRLADLCLALEIGGRAADWQAIERLFPELKPAVEQVRDYVDGLAV